jgi:pimeloyl-ACP methyl ester carboxylesterase
MKHFLVVLIALLAAVVVLPPLYYAVFPYEAAPLLPPPGQRVILPGGAGVNVIEEGDGPPVVLSHGLPGSAYDWRALLPEIADRGYRAIAYGRVGYGHSDPRPGGDYTPEANARELNGLLEALDLDDVTVVGWSYGGVTAMLAALENSSRLARIVLVGTGGPDSAEAEPPEPHFIMTLMNSEPVLRWRAAVPPTGVALMRAGSDMAFSGGPQPDWWLEGLRANFERWGTLMAYTGEMGGVASASIDATFDPESILQPVLILHGDDDWAAPVEIGRYLHTVIPRSELIEIEGGSHMLPVTHAAEIADRIAAFAAPAPG